MSTSAKKMGRAASPHRVYYFRRFYICSFDPHGDLMTPGNGTYVLERAQRGLIFRTCWKSHSREEKAKLQKQLSPSGKRGYLPKEILGPGLRGVGEYKLRTRFRVCALGQVSTAGGSMLLRASLYS